MSDIAAFKRSLELVREAITQALRAEGSEETQKALSVIMDRELPAISEDCNLGANDSWRLKIVTDIEATLRMFASARPISDADRARLVVSCARSLRNDIEKLMPALRG